MFKVEGCPFCNIDMKERVLKENEHANLFLSNPRKVEGHFLVTPKRHIEKPWELEPEELQSIFGLIFFTQRFLLEHYGSGVDIKQNYRPFIDQGRLKVNHLHFHVFPRAWEDELYNVVERHETALFADLPKAEAERISNLIHDTK